MQSCERPLLRIGSEPDRQRVCFDGGYQWTSANVAQTTRMTPMRLGAGGAGQVNIRNVAVEQAMVSPSAALNGCTNPNVLPVSRKTNSLEGPTRLHHRL
jgi:hypothetical protein